MSGTQRFLFVAGLLLVAAGIALGFIHAYIVGHQTLPMLRESYRTGWIAGLQSPVMAADPLAPAKEMSYRYTRVVDAHTHIIKLAGVLLLLALVYPLIALPDSRKRWLAAMFVGGSCIFPLSVYAEIFVKGRAPQVFAAVGATLVIVAFAGMLWGLLRGTRPASAS